MSQRLSPERLAVLREHLPLDVVEHIDALEEEIEALRAKTTDRLPDTGHFLPELKG